MKKSSNIISFSKEVRSRVLVIRRELEYIRK